MTAAEKFEHEILSDVSKWSNDEIYSFFGARLEEVVLSKKSELQSVLQLAWKNKLNYYFSDTGGNLDDESMLLFFDPKKIKKYSLKELLEAIQKLNSETYTNHEERN